MPSTLLSRGFRDVCLHYWHVYPLQCPHHTQLIHLLCLIAGICVFVYYILCAMPPLSLKLAGSLCDRDPHTISHSGSNCRPSVADSEHHCSCMRVCHVVCVRTVVRAWNMCKVLDQIFDPLSACLCRFVG